MAVLAVVVMVGVFGTMAAGVLHGGLGVPYPVSAIGYAAALGDLTAYPAHLGFLTSGVLFTALIAVPVGAAWRDPSWRRGRTIST